MKKALPVGIENFEDMRTNGYYYVDKTLFIKELLELKGKVNLFTRPRRFGKTLNLSMLRYFFEDTGDAGKNAQNKSLFQGLKIMEEGESYTRFMGQFPVMNLTLKSAKQEDFETAYYMIQKGIAVEFERHRGVVEQGKAKLAMKDYEGYLSIAEERAEEKEIRNSLLLFSRCMYQVTGKNTVILLDEYDVPLENAYFRGFYDEMVGFLRSLFESALKTNDYLQFAVITGCLRISRESIFTGLNHLGIVSVLDKKYSEHFGFTEPEVLQMMEYYGVGSRFPTMKEWYDGYVFGNTEVYNPWSAINFTSDLWADGNAFPRPYWVNTSSNDIIREMAARAGREAMGQIEKLLDGGTLDIQVHGEITYGDMHSNGENLWNFLFFTGYLKKISVRLEGEEQYLTMAIPNREVSYIYKNSIRLWLDKKQEGFHMLPLYAAIEEGDTEKIEEEVSKFLEETISYFDYGESYYHGFLAGLLKRNGKYRIQSNRETGLGRADLILKTPKVRNGRAVVLELKVVKRFQEMEKGCRETLRQIEEKKYKDALRQEGYEDILAYGICFYRKECMVQMPLDGRN